MIQTKSQKAKRNKRVFILARKVVVLGIQAGGLIVGLAQKPEDLLITTTFSLFLVGVFFVAYAEVAKFRESLPKPEDFCIEKGTIVSLASERR